MPVGAGLAKKGPLYGRNQYFPWSADRAVHDPAAPVDAQVETTGCGMWITKDLSELRIDYVSAESPLLGVWRSQRLKGQ